MGEEEEEEEEKENKEEMEELESKLIFITDIQSICLFFRGGAKSAPPLHIFYLILEAAMERVN